MKTNLNIDGGIMKICNHASWKTIFILSIGVFCLMLFAAKVHATSNESPTVLTKNGQPITLQMVMNDWDRWGASEVVWQKLEVMTSTVVVQFLEGRAVSVNSSKNRTYSDAISAITILGKKKTFASAEALKRIANYRYTRPEFGYELNARAAQRLLGYDESYHSVAYSVIDNSAKNNVVKCPYLPISKNRGSLPLQGQLLLEKWFSSGSDSVRLDACVCMAEVSLNDVAVYSYVKSKFQLVQDGKILDPYEKKQIDAALSWLARRNIGESMAMLEKMRAQ